MKKWVLMILSLLMMLTLAASAMAQTGEPESKQSAASCDYTVEFTYEGKQYVMPGDSSVRLSAILDGVGLTGEVSAVEISNTSLFSASNATGEWIVTAHRAFDTDEWMKVTINDAAYEIVVTDDQQVPVSYVDANGETQQCASYTLLTGSETELGEGWYVVGSNISYTNTIMLNGDVHLILCDGKTMNIGTGDSRINAKGIDYNPGGSRILTIYGQESNTGKLSVYTTGKDHNGIVTRGITVNGGTVIADTNGYGAAALFANGNITLNGGNVTACTAGNSGAAIYVGGDASSFYFNGGNVLTDTPGLNGKAIYVSRARYYFNWRKTGDQITIASSGLGTNWDTVTVSVQNDKTLKYVDDNGKKHFFSGTLTSGEIAEIAGKTLVPASLYTVNVTTDANGSVAVPALAEEGDTVTLTVKPNTGYELSALSVKQGETDVDTTVGENGTYTFTMPAANVTVTAVFHKHEFTYTANGATITATCANADNNCDLTNHQAMLTVNAPTDLTYDGQPKAAALNADYNKTAFPDTYTISYEGTGNTVYEKSTTAPTNAGDYKAMVTVGTVTAEMDFTIKKAVLTITAKDQTYEYNGQIQGPGDVVYADSAEIAKMVTAVGLQGNDAITSVEVDGQGKDVGTYELVPSSARVNEVSASENYDVKYINGTLKIQLPISYTVTFKVVNGSWNDGTSTDKTVTLTGYEGDMLKLTSDQIPAVGSKPNDTFKAGSWDVTPSTETAIRGATTYTYTYKPAEAAVYAVISATDTDHTVGDGRDAVVTVKRSMEDSRTFSLYTGSAMDGTALRAGSHNAAEGSLILTLKASYLDTLSPGNHRLTVSFRDGSAEAVVNIKAAEPVETPEVPKTGDAAEPVLWIALAALGLAVIIRVWMKSRKKS